MKYNTKMSVPLKHDEHKRNESSSLLNRIFQTMKIRVSSADKISDLEATGKIEFEDLTREATLGPRTYDLYPEKETFVYDVHISCHDYQLGWVEEVLLPVLEDQLHLKCFVMQRDRLPGVPTTHTVIEAIQSSRHNLVCFSPDYIASSWKQYEVFLAHHMDPSGTKQHFIPIMVEECKLPEKYQVFHMLRWYGEKDGMGLSSADKIRRKFFANGILKTFGVNNTELLQSVQNFYMNSKVPTSSVAPFDWDSIDAEVNKTQQSILFPLHKIGIESEVEEPV